MSKLDKIEQDLEALEATLSTVEKVEGAEFGEKVLLTTTADVFKRFIEKVKEGKTGWKEVTHEKSSYEIGKALEKLKAGKQEADLDIIAWAMIHHYNRTKEDERES